MLFILWFKFGPENAAKVLKLWTHFKYPADVKLIGRYLLIGMHTTVAIFEAQDEDALVRIVGPLSGLGITHISPAMKIEEPV